MRSILSICLFNLLILPLGPSINGQDTTSATQYSLNKIEIVGLRKLSKEKVIEASNLKLGQMVDLTTIKTAANRLHDTGWFNSVTYQYQFAEGKIDVTFEVAEKVLDPGPVKLGSIEFLGLKKITNELVLKESGLQIGQPAERADFEAAAKRLMDTGYFLRATYGYKNVNEQIQLVFEITERRWDVPCVFENFIWFTDQEVISAIRQEIPPFEGMAPDSGIVIDKITKTLARLLQQKAISGHVNYTPLAGLEENRLSEDTFRVIGVSMPICSLNLSGASVSAASQLTKAFKPLLQSQYSRSELRSFIENQILSYYRQRGFLRAGISSPQIVLSDSSDKKCRNGVTITLPVVEGAAYVWDRAEWSGNQVLTNDVLNNLMSMKSGVVADTSKIQNGLNTATLAYGRQGYLETNMTAVADFDDANRRVLYRVTVTEGPRYRMGKLLITGLAENELRKLEEKWKLKPGDIFDASYPGSYNLEVIGQKRAKPPILSTKLDKTNQTVDVIFTF